MHAAHHTADTPALSADVFASNPFMQLMDRKTVVRTMYRSAELRGLHSETYHPLDKPWISVTVAAAKKQQLNRATVV